MHKAETSLHKLKTPESSLKSAQRGVTKGALPALQLP